ncbi:MAG: DUF2007 domain-containing protein [Chloroflexi bacterium]|nr:MAG: DUF2007 domain-containing protein [Chloroflexota bacterium]
MSEVAVEGPADRPSAELAVAMLQQNGIHARVAPGPLETTWTIGSPTRANPVRILVPEEDAARAQELLGVVRRAPPAEPSRLGIAVVVLMLVVAVVLVGAVLARPLLVR